MISQRQQEHYWQLANYRSYKHTVVKAYVEPKLRYIDELISLRNLRLLDIGCGNGVYAYYLKKKYNCIYTGTDISPFMVKTNPVRPCLVSDSICLPFHDNTFDVVFAANILHHISNPLSAIAEMKRISKTHLIFIEPNVLNPIMLAFSLIVKAERGGLRSFMPYLQGLLKKNGIVCVSHITTGMISQNNTPECMLPFLKPFDINFPLGEYHILIGKKS